jgi:hypothetical protein
MGMLMGALAGAAKAVERTTEYALRSMMDEEKGKRIAEAASALKSNEDLTTRARNKADAGEERARVAGIINEPVKVNQGEGLLGPATDDPAELAQTTREPTARERQNRLLTAGDLPNAERMGKDADRSEDNALNSRKLDEAAKRQDAWTANEAVKRENEAKRIEAMFAKIDAAGAGKDKTPTRVAEATQIMEQINKERVAAGKPKITFEDALQMHYKSADPAKETVTYENDGQVRERKVTRPITDKTVTTQKTVKFGDLNK